jgi:hypothetical protein
MQNAATQKDVESGPVMIHDKIEITELKGSQYFGIKVYNSLPGNIKHLSKSKTQFKKALLQFLHLHAFYNLE